MEFTIFNVETGEIIRRGLCAENDLQNQIQPNDPKNYIIVDEAIDDDLFTIEVDENGPKPVKRSSSSNDFLMVGKLEE